MTRLSIVHKTAYKYNRRVTLSYNEARMTPLTDGQQVVLESSLKVSPNRASVSTYRDYWGTRVTAFDMQMPHEHGGPCDGHGGSAPHRARGNRRRHRGLGRHRL